MKLQGKVALISGGGRGIGRAVALGYAREGAKVAICSRTPSEINAVGREIEALGGTSVFLACDVSKEDEVMRCVEETLSRFGEIHVLVNNAGVMSRAAPIAEFEIRKWDYTLSVNLRGPFLLSRAVLPHMQKAKKGSIINVSSSLGRRSWPNFGAYSVSKAALEALTLVLAEEVRSSGIRVNSVDPGYVATKITHFSGSSPDSVTPVFVYLASDESKAITAMQLTASHWQSEIKRL